MKRELCPVVQAHKRILEAHRLWHQACSSYYDPEAFRTNINATIQALRNVTFALQNCKHNVPDFDNWYSDWVEESKKDVFMCWLCDARTAIVHKKDLELYSKATVTVRCYETILAASIDVPIFLSSKEIVAYLKAEGIIDEEIQQTNAYATVKRQWIVEQFPDHDVLYLLAYCLGQLVILVEAAHTKKYVSMANCTVVDTLHPLDLDADSIPKCMNPAKIKTEDLIQISDLSSRERVYKRISPNPKITQKALRRYRNISLGSLPLSHSDPFIYGEKLHQMARKILQKDGHHNNVIFLKKPSGNWDMLSPVYTDQVSKFILWNDLATKVRQEGITAIIHIAECWLGSFEIYEQTGKRASEQPNKTECLCVEIFTSDLVGKAYRSIFHKNIMGRVVFDGDTTIEDVDMDVGYIKPVANVWHERKETLSGDSE